MDNLKHATLMIAGYRIPLIGIEPRETLEECDCCHDIFSIQQIQLTGTQFLCPKCRDTGYGRDTGQRVSEIARDS